MELQAGSDTHCRSEQSVVNPQLIQIVLHLIEIVDARQRMHRYISLNILGMPLFTYSLLLRSDEGNCKPSSVVSHIG